MKFLVPMRSRYGVRTHDGRQKIAEVVDASESDARGQSVLAFVGEDHVDVFRPLVGDDTLTPVEENKSLSEDGLREKIAAWRADPDQTWRFSAIDEHELNESG